MTLSEAELLSLILESLSALSVETHSIFPVIFAQGLSLTKNTTKTKKKRRKKKKTGSFSGSVGP